MVINTVSLAVFIVLSCFFSCAETAIFSLSELKIRRLNEKSPYGRFLKNILTKPTRLISTITIGNLIANVGFSSLITAIFVYLFGDGGLIYAVGLSGLFILLVGEVFPKTIAIYLAEKIAPPAAFILTFFAIILRPFTFIFDKVVSFFLFLIIPYFKRSRLGYEELKSALFLGKKEGQISALEETMVSHVLEFKDTWASEIMTHRIDIKAISSDCAQEEVVKILTEKKQSKFPVYSSSVDNIIGILYAKDVFLNPKTDYRLLLRAPIFIPESQRIDDLLKIFLEKNERIAIVLDEYGGTFGLVTLEDIEEEIFGEIYDEFESPTKLIEKIDQSSYRVHGRTPIKDAMLALKIELPQEQDTLAGFLISRFEKIPHSGEKFIFGDLEFTIERASVKRIISIIVKKLSKNI